MSINTTAVEQMATVPDVKPGNLSARFLVDAATAVTAAVTVSPIVAAVDK